GNILIHPCVDPANLVQNNHLVASDLPEGKFVLLRYSCENTKMPFKISSRWEHPSSEHAMALAILKIDCESFLPPPFVIKDLMVEFALSPNSLYLALPSPYSCMTFFPTGLKRNAFHRSCPTLPTISPKLASSYGGYRGSETILCTP